MLLFNNPSIITLDCFTNRNEVFTYNPIIPSTQALPEWWKQLNPYIIDSNGYSKTGTMKSCSGFIEFYKNGAMMPMWSSFVIEKEKDRFKYHFADRKTIANPHSKNQKTGFLESEFHLKINSPWLFKTKQDVKFFAMKPFYNSPEHNDFYGYPGVIDFKYQHQVHINTGFKNTEEKSQIEVEAGDPILHLIPLSDKKLKIQNHLIDDTEFNKLNETSGQCRFYRNYKYLKDTLQGKK